MTAPPPGTAPRVRPAYSATTIIIAALAAALTLSTIVAVGWSTSSEMRARLRASDIMPYPIAASQWAQGAAQAWSSTVAADAEIIHAGDRVIVLERSSNKDPEAVLTSYAITDTGLNQEWMSTADLSKGTVDDPEFLLWNGDLVRGSTLIDLDTGESLWLCLYRFVHCPLRTSPQHRLPVWPGKKGRPFAGNLLSRPPTGSFRLRLLPRPIRPESLPSGAYRFGRCC